MTRGCRNAFFCWQRETGAQASELFPESALLFEERKVYCRKQTEYVCIMKIGVLCIGDELLKGAVINTNLAYMGQKLLELGIIPELSLEVPDRPEDVVRGSTMS